MDLSSNEFYRHVNDEHYPYDFPDRTVYAGEIQDETDAYLGTQQTAFGRIIAKRLHSNFSFYDLEDPSGVIQVVVQSQNMDEIGNSTGDIVAAEGRVGLTEKGEISIFSEGLVTLSESLHPLHKHQFNEGHTSGQRFLDLMTHRSARETLLARSGILRATRQILESQGFVEMETPVVNTFYNGGVAKPFKTHINSLGKDAYLRVTSELYLKQLVTSGIERVYEITKQFRNEGLGPIYNPEFTVCEAYCAFEDDVWVMDTVEEIAHNAGRIARECISRNQLEQVTDITQPWERISMHDAVCRAMASEDINIRSESDVRRVAKDELGFEGDYDEALQALFKDRVEHGLLEPTFITDLPESLTPMAKRKRGDDSIVKKVMFFAGGIQMGDGCYEENNPRRQHENFVNQRERHLQSGFPEYPRDPDFMPAIHRAIPPMGGIAIGFDRMVMLATGEKHIKDVMAFRATKG